MPSQLPSVQLITMTEKTFERWSARLIQDYAKDHVEAGNWTETEALEKARESVGNLLPAGVKTKDHYLYTVADRATGQEVGVLWLGIRAEKTGFIYDLEIHEAFRRKGYAAAAMQTLEVEAKRLGAEKLSLHVFAHNDRARALYEKLGYETTDISMAKKLV